VFVALVIFGLALWLWTTCYTSNLEREWIKWQENLQYIEDENKQIELMTSGDVTLEQYGWMIRPLRVYPVVFVIFGAPTVAFFADGCASSNNGACVHAVEFCWVR
jgi:hypothetical protein